MMLIYIFNLNAQETSVFKTSEQPKKSAAEGLKYRCFLDFQIKNVD